MKRVLTAIAACLVTMAGIAQHITGTVTDKNGQPLALANVVLLQEGDSALVGGTTTAGDGTFSLPQPVVPTFARITILGYKTAYVAVKPDMGQITLDDDTQLLSEVTVTSQMPKTLLKDGGMTTHIAGTILERAGTAEQMLDRLPNVTAKDGKVEVLGRGTPIIYINGRLMREDNELLRLQSADIKSVEVITNPGARYDASATSVIRITTKPKAGDGFSLYSQSWLAREESGLWRGHESLTLNYRINGLDLGGSLYYNQWSRRDDRDLATITMLSKAWVNRQSLRQRYNGKDFFAKLRLSYAFSENNSVGASFSYDRYPEMPCWGYDSAKLYENDSLSDNTFTTYESDDQRTDLNGNAYYVGKIGNIGIDLNTDWYYGKHNEWMSTEDAGTTVHTDTRTRNRLIATKLVVTAPLLGGQLSVGGEYSYSKRTTRYNVTPAGIIDDDDSRIQEDMASAFAEWSRTFGRLSLNAGLRYEYVDFSYYDHDVRIAEQSRTFSDLFPSVSLTLPVGKTQMMLTYATNIDRPSYWMLRSNTTYANQYTYETGNPFLVPQLRDNLTYTLSYKWLTYTAMFSRMRHPLMASGEMYKDQPGTMLLSYQNGDSYNLMFTQISLSPKVGIWSPMLSLGVMKQWMDLTTFDGHSINNPKATFRFNNTLTTKLCDITLAMMAQTSGGDMNEYFRSGYFNADLTLSRSMLKKRLMLQLDISNLFHTGEHTVRDYYGSLQGSDIKNLHQQRIALTVRYNLNTTRSKYRGTGAGESQKSRM